jgi:hypothetical protein
MQGKAGSEEQTCEGYAKLSQGTRHAPNAAYRSAVKALLQGLGGKVTKIPSSRCTMPSNSMLHSSSLSAVKKKQMRQRVVARTCVVAADRVQADKVLRGILAEARQAYPSILRKAIIARGATGVWTPKPVKYKKFKSVCIQGLPDTHCATAFNPAAYPDA